ncbi:response regulator transcription factor [Neobacillus kokaensis]|uniref:AraC family transcriptional regulator n=1 Tax=Neobacillus kokaensis TaxID=2759023 RepID=A0ABQ3N7K5_9BACI|nr:response regulator [Neobacillus kokaensis]GHI00027.1 hypothetical protein AM1BK_35690 [Neobacillus kokaensis]
MKVLIVEDDYLVRKGLRLMMPWEDFDLEIVGEASDGEEAIQFIREHHVDLLITDIAMPKVTGLDLLRFVHGNYPHIWTVALTFHKEFEYIQEVLRLGAIDYITKTQLEKEKMNEVLARIMNRIKYEQDRRQRTDLMMQNGIPFSSHDLYGILANPYSKKQAEVPPVPEGGSHHSLIKIDNGFWLFMGSRNNSIQGSPIQTLKHSTEWIILEAVKCEETDLAGLIHLFRKYCAEKLFYDYRYDENYYKISLKQSPDQDTSTDCAVQTLRNSLSSLQCITNDELFDETITKVKEFRVPSSQVEGLFTYAVSKWEKFAKIPTDDPLDKMYFWQDWISWLEKIRNHLQGTLKKSPYSNEVVSSIMRAIEIIHRDISSEVKLKDVANEVHLSQSYFSQCFRNIVGIHFNDYVRNIRISSAKALLHDTNKPIYWVASQIGYHNEKYFSKIFRKYTGMLPSEYRTMMK